VCHRLSMGNGVHLRCVWITNGERKDKTVVFVPGWFSLPESWRSFLPHLVTHADVLYFETREKRSAILAEDASLDIGTYVDDLIALWESDLVRRDRPCFLAGSSLGAAVIIDSIDRLHPPPDAIALVSPNYSFPMPAVAHLLKILPARMLPAVKAFIGPIALRLRVNRKDPGHATKFMNSFDQAEPHRLRESSLAVRRYVPDIARLQTYRNPALVIAGSEDRHHALDQVQEIVAQIPQVTFRELRSFTACHSSAAAKFIRQFFDQVTKKHPTPGIRPSRHLDAL
jgi:pimeloyl-ACP methyl ester carboxylesterase